jgi:16S rRNA (guanine527-N7)-methyltransferase
MPPPIASTDTYEPSGGAQPPLEWDDLPELFPGLRGTPAWLTQLQRHAELVGAATAHTRVTSVDPRDAIRRQYAECLEILRIADEAGATGPYVDVGSGGGFPGLIIAAVRPADEVHLVEPLQKRARLLDRMAHELGLPHVTVHPARAEDAGRGALRGHGGLVTARAVAPLSILLELTAPLVRPGGLLALPKGSGGAGELAEAAAAMRALQVAHSGSVAMRPQVNPLASVVLFRPMGPCPPSYPRRAGIPQRRPL